MEVISEYVATSAADLLVLGSHNLCAAGAQLSCAWCAMPWSSLIHPQPHADFSSCANLHLTESRCREVVWQHVGPMHNLMIGTVGLCGPQGTAIVI